MITISNLSKTYITPQLSIKAVDNISLKNKKVHNKVSGKGIKISERTEHYD